MSTDEKTTAVAEAADIKAKVAEAADSVAEAPKDAAEAAEPESVQDDAAEAGEKEASKPEETVVEAESEKKEEVKSDKKEKAPKKDGSEGDKRGSGKKSLFDPSVLPESNDPVEMRKQVEFYFCDSNLPFDKFLYGLVTKNNNGVPLKLIASFKRMQRFKDYDTLLEALKSSETLEVFTGKGGGDMVKRKIPLDLSRESIAVTATTTTGEKIKKKYDPSVPRSIYAKGFGEETPTTQIDVEKMFEPYGPINAVRLRREEDSTFKGSIFVEFSSEELMQKFIALEEKPKFNDQELIYKTKKDFIDEKVQLIHEGKIKPKEQRSFRHKKFNAYAAEGKGESDRGRGRGRGGKGDRGRGRGRGGRGRGGDRNAEKRADANKKGNGIPQVLDTPSAAAGGDAAPAAKSEESSTKVEVPNGKRKAEDVGGEPDKEAKKVRVDEAQS